MLVVAFVLLAGGVVLMVSGVTDPEDGVLGLLGGLMDGKLPKLRPAGDPLDRVPELTAPVAAATKDKGTGTTAPATGGGIVGEARRQLGKPYGWGAEGPNAFDCSGLTWWAVAKGAGMRWTRTTAEGQRISPLGKTVKAGSAVAGDLVFFGIPASHCGVYVGGGQMIHAPTRGSVVKLSAVAASPARPITYRRFPK